MPDPPPPRLKYSAAFREKLAAHPRSASIKRTIRSIQRSNTVVHAQLEHTRSPRAVQVATLLGSVHPFSKMLANPRVRLVSAPEDSSPFSHRKFRTSEAGRLLLFRTGNLIRAGKHTHGDAVRSVLSFVVWANEQSDSLLWPSTISCPNTVCSAVYAEAISPAVKEHWKASWSTRFPGISITFPDCPGVTTELFLNKSNFIAPGVKSPEDLVKVANGMAELHAQVGAAPKGTTPPATKK